MPPDGVRIWGLGGAGCKVVSRVIADGFNPDYFVTIDADAGDLAASQAGYQIQCGYADEQRAWVMTFEDRQHAEAQIAMQLGGASKVVLVAGLGGRTGGNWLLEIASVGGLAERHVKQNGVSIAIVGSLPFAREGLQHRYAAAGVHRAIAKGACSTHIIDNSQGEADRRGPVSREALVLVEEALAARALSVALG